MLFCILVDETTKSNNSGFEVRHTYSGIFGKGAVWWRGVRFVSGSVRAMFSAVREGSSVVHLHFFHVGTLALINVLLARHSHAQSGCDCA